MNNGFTKEVSKMHERLRELIENSDNIVFFGGAGVSTESGIPDFRSTDGLYSQKYNFPPEIILSHSFFISNTKDFYDFYKEKMIFEGVLPNKAHLALARFEKQGKLKAVITQNIDGLHQAAGSKNVIELHGSIHRNFCTSCNKPYALEHIKNSDGIPKCDCGGVVKPDVVLYEEPPKNEDIKRVIEYISGADMLIVGGSSLSVYPAAGLIDYYRGDKLILINKSATLKDSKADLVINAPIGEVLGSVW